MSHTPISTDDVFAGLSRQVVFELEKQFGNTDLIRALDYAHMAGPFKVVSPWELEDPKGVRRINASGYAATPFGDHYPPLMNFVRRYFEEDEAMGLPQQGCTDCHAERSEEVES